jgi:predicted transcriptional regulator of viral defense system
VTVASSSARAKPNWDRLFEVAAAQEGYFTTSQAAEAGYSSQLLLKHIRAGRVSRTRRGIYRLVHFPAAEHDELTIAWLWSERAGIISHQTALALHGLSDVLSAHVHLTLPSTWRHRRFRVPADIVLHYADVPSNDRAWFGAVPTTNPRRTLNDCARAGLSPELLQQAAQQALRRGLVTRSELRDVEDALQPFGGLGP